MLELKNGRPEEEAGRLEKEIRTYDFLDKLGIEYKRIDHAPAMTMEVCEEIDKSLQATICKNLFLCNRQETQFYLLMMLGNKKFLTKDLSKILGVSRLSFAKEEYMEELLDITPGSVSVMGLMNDVGKKVRLIIDEEVLRDEEIGCHPCINTSSIKFRTKDLTEKIIPAMEHDYTVVSLPRYEEEQEIEITQTPETLKTSKPTELSFYKSVIEQDRSSIVICDLQHTIIYMNPAAIANYAKRGGAELIGKNLLDCHNADSCKKIKEVIEWFAASEEHNLVYTFYNEKQNKDVYMVALREEGRLIGYYEKHEYRNRETMKRYDFMGDECQS